MCVAHYEHTYCEKLIILEVGKEFCHVIKFTLQSVTHLSLANLTKVDFAVASLTSSDVATWKIVVAAAAVGVVVAAFVVASVAGTFSFARYLQLGWLAAARQIAHAASFVSPSLLSYPEILFP